MRAYSISLFSPSVFLSLPGYTFSWAMPTHLATMSRMLRQNTDRPNNAIPNLPSVHYALGRLAFDSADYPTAREDFRKEIELNPGFGEAYLYLGATLQREGETASALPSLRRL